MNLAEERGEESRRGGSISGSVDSRSYAGRRTAMTLMKPRQDWRGSNGRRKGEGGGGGRMKGNEVEKRVGG